MSSSNISSSPSSSSPTLYHVPRTISSPIVQVLSELKAVPGCDGERDDSVTIETLTFAQLKTPEHLARNPMGTSPAFVDESNGIAIWESGAVLSYLLEVYDPDYKLHPSPSSPRLERANFLHLQQYIIATVYPFVASLFIHTLKPEEEQDKDYVETAKDKWRTLLAPTLTKFLGDSKYFMGDQISAIDFLVTKPLGNADSLGLLDQSDFPGLRAVYDEIRSMPSYQLAYKAGKKVGRCRSMVLIPTKD